MNKLNKFKGYQFTALPGGNFVATECGTTSHIEVSAAEKREYDSIHDKVQSAILESDFHNQYFTYRRTPAGGFVKHSLGTFTDTPITIGEYAIERFLSFIDNREGMPVYLR